MKSSLLFLVHCVCVATAFKSAVNNEDNTNDSNFTFTYSMVLRCKEHLSLNGYNYYTFYEVVTQTRTPQTVGAAFEMHIAILGSSNGHILLSTLPFPDPNDPVYEIVVGGGGNKFTELRRNLRRNAKTSAKTTGILSAVDFRAFYIRISEDGLIEFGREGDKLPILSYMDVNPITVNYFSFAAWNGIEAKFLYDCPDPTAANDTSPNSTEIDRKLSNSDFLKRTLLMGCDPNVPPNPEMEVKIGMRVTNIRYNAFQGMLSLGISIVAIWTDDSLAWDPNKFNGTTSLKFRQGQIWRPKFFNFKSEDIKVLDGKNPELISMVHSGEATFHFRTVINTMCFDDAGQITARNTWPRDEYLCTVLIGAWEPHEKIVLHALNLSDPKMNFFSGMDDVLQNEWEKSIKMMIVSNQIWGMIFDFDDNITHQSDRLLISIDIKRKATTYNIVFYTPLLVLLMFLLMAFWTEPLQLSRVWFYTGCIIVITIGLCYVDYLIPTHNVPSLLILYITVLMGIILAMFVHVIMMTEVFKRLCKTATMQSIITAKWLRMTFCLPVIQTCNTYESINEGYASQEDEDLSFLEDRHQRPNNLEEMQTDATKYGDVNEFAQVVDKVLFLVYSLTIAIMMGLHF